MRAATAVTADLIDGVPVLEAARLGADEIEAAIGGLTPAKRHAAQLAADALHRALAGVAASSERIAEPAPRAASWSPCPAGSTAPSPPCSNVSAGRR